MKSLVILLLLIFWGLGPLSAQAAGPIIPVVQEHWVYDLLDRMAAAGVAEGSWLPGHRPSTVDGILRALAAADEDGDPQWAEVIAGTREWVIARYGPADAKWGLVPGAELRSSGGPSSDGLGAGVRHEAFWSPGAGLALFVTPVLELGEGGARLDLARGGLAWRVGSVLLTASRDNVRYGRGARGGIILGDESVLDGFQAALLEPLQPSGLLRWLGAVDGSVHLGRIGADEYGMTAVFLAGELRLRPHPRLQLGIHRSALVVGTSPQGDRIGARDLVYLGIGKHSDFEDQRLALTASARVTVAAVDVVPYAELGLEDSAGMDEDPGIVVGLHAPVLPGFSAPIGLRYEYAAFGRDARVVFPGSCCYSARYWYRHFWVRSEYRDGRGRPLGHPLAGYGHEHLLEMQAPLVIRGTSLRAGAFSREREGFHTDELEGQLVRPNLLFAEFPGRSRGGYVEALTRRGDLELGVALAGEVSREGWNRTEGQLLIRWLGLTGSSR